MCFIDLVMYLFTDNCSVLASGYLAQIGVTQKTAKVQRIG